MEDDMKTYSIIFMTIIVIIGTGCQQKPATLTEAQTVEIEKEVRGQWNAYLKAINGLDFNKVMTFYSINQFVGYLGGTHFALFSRQAFRDSVQSWFNRRAQQKVEPMLVTIHVLKPDLVMLLFTGHFTTVGKSGKQHQYESAETFLFIKENIGWKILHEHESWTSIKYFSS
jgi:ketosteroid isomerase-like protein